MFLLRNVWPRRMGGVPPTTVKLPTESELAPVNAQPLDARLCAFGYRLGGALVAEFCMHNLPETAALIRVDSLDARGVMLESCSRWKSERAADGSHQLSLHYPDRRMSELAGWSVAVECAEPSRYVGRIPAPLSAAQTAELTGADGASLWTFAAENQPVRASLNTRVFHQAGCGLAGSASPQRRFQSAPEALRGGFKPCRTCHRTAG